MKSQLLKLQVVGFRFNTKLDISIIINSILQNIDVSIIHVSLSMYVSIKHQSQLKILPFYEDGHSYCLSMFFKRESVAIHNIKI